MTTTRSLACAVALLAVAATTGGAFAQEAMPGMITKTSAGPILVDAKGMTLYTFDKDSASASACTGKCADNWPPLAAGAKSKANGDWSLVEREDGSEQWAYKTKPLYTWVKDKKPGDVTGDGVNEVWHIAKP